MKKLSLSVEALRVDSFATGGGDAENGTVVAHDTAILRPCCGTAHYTCAGRNFDIC